MAFKLDNSYKVFYASSSWLDGWTSRYSIRQFVVSWEQLSSAKSGATEYKEKVKNVTGRYTKDKIYNADKTDINLKILSAKSLISKQEKSAWIQKE